MKPLLIKVLKKNVKITGRFCLKLTLVLALACFFSLKANGQWMTPSGIREILVTGLPDIAMAGVDNSGPVIYINPDGAQQVGSYAFAFFMAHEYGHHYLGHIVGQLSGDPYVQQWLNANMEDQADAYAVRYWITRGNKLVIQAGAQVMWNIDNPGDDTHRPSRVRANNIAALFFQLTQTPLFP